MQHSMAVHSYHDCRRIQLASFLENCLAWIPHGESRADTKAFLSEHAGVFVQSRLLRLVLRANPVEVIRKFELHSARLAAVAADMKQVDLRMPGPGKTASLQQNILSDIGKVERNQDSAFRRGQRAKIHTKSVGEQAGTEMAEDPSCRRIIASGDLNSFDNGGGPFYDLDVEPRARLLSVLHAAQNSSGGNYLPPDQLEEIRRSFSLTRAELRGVATYYSLFSLKPRGKNVIRICRSPICRMMGSTDLLDVIRQELGVEIGETTSEGLFTLEETQCIGQCAGAPAVMVNEQIHDSLTSETVKTLLNGLRRGASASTSGEMPRKAAPGERRIALQHAGIVPPLDIDGYTKAGGYAALRKAVSQGPDKVLEELTRAILRGRGGAGFPAGIKGRAASNACDVCERYVVCNADEGEPGTFKDRIIMEGEPHLLIEGMTIGAWAIGAAKGYIYVRGEYGQSIARLQQAIRDAAARGFLGQNILGSGFAFDVEVRAGAGSYLCGEELTLLESIEGKRGYPRIKPPFPAESGLWGMPTLVNNVETLANIPFIVAQGASAYLALGTASSPGTKIFCLSGDVNRPGYVEVEMGIPLRSLIEDFAGGVKGGGDPAAVLLGGAAGTFVSASMLDLPMDYDALKKAGATLGSGAVIVMGKDRSIPEMLSSIMDFFRHESCGKCVPCRVGTARLAVKARELEGMPRESRRAALEDMVREAEMMEKTSLCPLGQSPVLPLRSAARHLAEFV
jgi:NADH:ubiquinone oxidoreductase subunit F (NADH-binding)/NADH:ubiquinone oxidoreductase subunit E